MPSEHLDYQEPKWKKVVRNLGATAAKVGWKAIPHSIYINQTALHLALTRICNARCVFCPIDQIEKADSVHMSDEVFARVLEGIQDTHYRSAHLSPDVGEPLLAPGFHDKVRALRREGISFVEVTTNGTFLKRVGLDRLLDEEGPDEINISFPGFDEEMYRRVYRTKKYQLTRDNIMELLRKNDELGRPKVVQLWLRGDLDIDEIMAAPEMEEVLDLAHSISYMTEVDSWLGMIKQDQLTGKLVLQKHKAELKKRPCARVFDMKIYPDGGMHLCSCRNILKDPDLEIGNILEISLPEAIERTPQILEAWERGQIPKSCQSCVMYSDPSVGFLGAVRRNLNKRSSEKELRFGWTRGG